MCVCLGGGGETSLCVLVGCGVLSAHLLCVCVTVLQQEQHNAQCSCCTTIVLVCCLAVLQVTAIFDSSLEVMISVFGETPSIGKVRAGVGRLREGAQVE